MVYQEIAQFCSQYLAAIAQVFSQSIAEKENSDQFFRDSATSFSGTQPLPLARRSTAAPSTTVPGDDTLHDMEKEMEYLDLCLTHLQRGSRGEVPSLHRL